MKNVIVFIACFIFITRGYAQDNPYTSFGHTSKVEYSVEHVASGNDDEITYYRFAFNGQEKSTELDPNHYTAKYWEYDSRAARRWNKDPKPTTGIGVYATFSNNPISFSDVNGDTVKYEGTEEDIKLMKEAFLYFATSALYAKLAKQLETSKYPYVFKRGADGSQGGEFVGNFFNILKAPPELELEPRIVPVDEIGGSINKGGRFLMNLSTVSKKWNFTHNERVTILASFVVEEVVHAAQYDDHVKAYGNYFGDKPNPTNIEFEAKAIVGIMKFEEPKLEMMTSDKIAGDYGKQASLHGSIRLNEYYPESKRWHVQSSYHRYPTPSVQVFPHLLVRLLNER